MDTEKIEKKIEIEIDLFKMYSVFLIGLITGITTIIFEEQFYQNKIKLIVLILGLLFLTFVIFVFVKSYIKIYKLTKKL